MLVILDWKNDDEYVFFEIFSDAINLFNVTLYFSKKVIYFVKIAKNVLHKA